MQMIPAWNLRQNKQFNNSYIFRFSTFMDIFDNLSIQSNLMDNKSTNATKQNVLNNNISNSIILI